MALKAQQSVIQVNDSGYKAIEEVVNITGPDGKAKLIDTTNLGSTGKEYLQGIADFGQISLDCNFTGGTEQMFLRTQYSTQAALIGYKILVPDGTGLNHTFSFNAIVSAWNLDLKTDDKVGLKVTLQVSGSVTYALV